MNEPALDPQNLDRLARLTREYARYASECAGLGTVLGGALVLLLMAADLLWHGGRLPLWGAFAPLPLARLLPLAGLPFLWLALRQGLRTRWYQRHGRVEPAETPRPRRAILAVAAVVWLGAALAVLDLGGATGKPLRAVLITGLMAAFLFALLRLSLPRLERLLAAFLFVVPAFLLAGVQLPAGDLLVSLPAMGVGAVVLGLREHAAFRRVERELAALQGVA